MLKSGQSYVFQKLFGGKFSSAGTRKVVFVCIVACVTLYYLIPFFYKRISIHFTFGNVGKHCMKRELDKVLPNVNDFDAVVTKLPIVQTKNEKVQIPFVGNGKIGSIAEYINPSLHVFYEREISNKLSETTELLRLPFSLMITPQYDSKSKQKEESVVLHYRHGIVERLTCFSISDNAGSGVIFVNHTVVAHRSRPNVFLQHLEAKLDEGHKSSFAKGITLHQDGPAAKPGFRPLPGGSGNTFKLYGGTLEVQRKHMAVVVAVSNIPSKLNIQTDNTGHVDSISVIMHSNLLPDKSKSNAEQTRLGQAASSYMSDLLATPIDTLLQEHKNAWNDILHTGLSIAHSTSLEPGIPHPLSINSTLYSVLSSMDSKLHDKDIPEKERRDLMKRLQTPDFCYNDNPTLHAKKLWQPPESVENIMQLSKLWSLTLRKSGCSHLVSEGAEGMLQAIVLSFGRLQFTEYDLQVHTDSDILHNDIAFRGVLYKNNSVDIEMRYVDGQSSIAISLKKASQWSLYACEAGCQSNPVPVTEQRKIIPVYITYPPSPILYLSESKKHLEDLKQTIVVKRIVDHAQHIESQKEPGLPLLFWLGIGSLIVLFHLYLIRMICKEYQSSATLPSTLNRNYYSNRGRLAS